MGKSNRIKSNRAAKVAAAPIAKKKKGVPGWLYSFIAIVIAVAVLASVVGGILSSNGIFMRMTTVMSTQNHKVTSNMMTYFFNSNIQTFYSDYSTYLSSGYFSVDLSQPLKNQEFGKAKTEGATVYDALFLGSFTGTWYDYFMETTKTQVREMLVYAEEATARGITLDDADKAAIESEITAISTYATIYQYTTDSYISMYYGDGVRETDIRDALELSALANKCVRIISEEYDDALPLDSQDIISRYEQDKLKFNVISYSYYTYSVEYDDAVEEVCSADATDAEIAEKKDEIKAKYIEMVKAEKAKADALKGLTTEEEFEKFIITDYVNTYFDDVLKSEKIDEDVLPEEAIRNDIKAKMIEEIITAVLKGEELPETEGIPDGAETTTAYGHADLQVAYAKGMYAVREDLFTDAQGVVKSNFVENASYTETKFLKWAFEQEENGTRAQFDIMEDGNEFDENKEVNDESSYSASIYMLTKTQAPNKEASKNLGFATFSTSDDAKAFITALKEKGATSDLEAFKALASEKGANNSDVIENYIEGGIGNSTFDQWVFADTTEKGMYSSTPIEMSEGYFIVLLANGDGEEKWKVEVKDTLLTERVNANYASMLAKYAPIDKPKALSRIKEVALG